MLLIKRSMWAYIKTAELAIIEFSKYTSTMLNISLFHFNVQFEQSLLRDSQVSIPHRMMYTGHQATWFRDILKPCTGTSNAPVAYEYSFSVKSFFPDTLQYNTRLPDYQVWLELLHIICLRNPEESFMLKLQNQNA